jgi:hypothetical protein
MLQTADSKSSGNTVPRGKKVTKPNKSKCSHRIAFHHGHSTYTLREYKEARKEEDLSCCGGTELLNHCPDCGKSLRTLKKKLEGEKKNG